MIKQKNENEMTFKDCIGKSNAEKFLNQHNIQNYTIFFSNGTPHIIIDVEGNVILSGKNLTNAGIPVKFRRVSGNFDCSNNQLTSLDFAPEEVGENFYCDNNNITSLSKAPIYIGGNFYCCNNKLTNIDDISTKYVGKNFYTRNNDIKDYKVLNEIVKGIKVYY